MERDIHILSYIKINWRSIADLILWQESRTETSGAENDESNGLGVYFSTLYKSNVVFGILKIQNKNI